jgi:predicted nucleotidyltransferase component of viral defense system
MRLSQETLNAEAHTTGFRPEVLEKVLHLLNLLDGLRSHPFLKGKLVLKGGTALNLFIFDMPRLSVDIDLNYIGSTDLATMQQERPQIEQAIQAVCAREDVTVDQSPKGHAGGKWRLRYPSAVGHDANLELDVAFMFRVPLFPIERRNSRKVGSYAAKDVPIVELHELAAGKLAALFARTASRDLFDSHSLLTQASLDPVKLRSAFIAYGAMNRKDWRTISIDDIKYEPRELQNQLVPTLRASDVAGIDARTWATGLVETCRAKLQMVYPFKDAEREFLDRLLDNGEIRPELITSDSDLATRIASHPGINWKAQNVREHKERRN